MFLKPVFKICVIGSLYTCIHMYTYMQAHTHLPSISEILEMASIITYSRIWAKVKLLQTEWGEQF